MKPAEVAAEFMDRIEEEYPDSQVTWHDDGETIEIDFNHRNLSYSFSFKIEKMESFEEIRNQKMMGKCHSILAEAMEEVKENGS